MHPRLRVRRAGVGGQPLWRGVPSILIPGPHTQLLEILCLPQRSTDLCRLPHLPVSPVKVAKRVRLGQAAHECLSMKGGAFPFKTPWAMCRGGQLATGIYRECKQFGFLPYTMLVMATCYISEVVF